MSAVLCLPACLRVSTAVSRGQAPHGNASFPAEDDHGAWHRYNRAPHAILRRPDGPTLTTAMRRAAQACGMERDTSHARAPPDLTLQQLVHDILTRKEELATLLRPSTPEA